MTYKSYKLLEPFQLGPVTLRNRIVFAPTGSWYAPPDGYCNQRLIDHYTRLAKGGLGLIVGEFLRVNDVDSAYAANTDYRLRVLTELKSMRLMATF